MERTWRWFGKKDKITLAQLKQIGVEGIVTALHDVPLGEVWTREKIHELKEYIESYGMKWSVVESLPVVETLKYGGPDRDHQIEVYKESLRNLGEEGIKCICYNFMPVLDWARTDLTHDNPNGATNLYMNWASLLTSTSISFSVRAPVRIGRSSPRTTSGAETSWLRPTKSRRLPLPSKTMPWWRTSSSRRRASCRATSARAIPLLCRSSATS